MLIDLAPCRSSTGSRTRGRGRKASAIPPYLRRKNSSAWGGWSRR